MRHPSNVIARKHGRHHEDHDCVAGWDGYSDSGVVGSAGARGIGVGNRGRASPARKRYTEARAGQACQAFATRCKARGSATSRRTPGASAASCRTPGATAAGCRTPGASAAGCRTPGASAASCRTPGASATGCRTPGATAASCRNAHASTASCRTPCASATGCRDSHATAASCRNAHASAAGRRNPAPPPPAAARPAPPPPAAATPTPPPPTAANPAPTARPFVQPGKPVPVAKPAVVPPPAALRGRGGRPAAGVAAPAAAVVPTATPANVRRMDDFRSQRREVREGDRTIIREPGRTIIKEGNVTVIRRDESDRFRYGARNMIAERRGNELRTIAVRPDGSRIINVTDDTGRLVRRVRRDQFGREFVMFDNSRSGMGAGTAFGIGVAAGFAAGLGVAYLADVPPPVITIPQDQYIVDTRYAPPAMLYDTLAAPPIDAIERSYTLDEIRYTPALRQRMRSVDINTLTFDSG